MKINKLVEKHCAPCNSEVKTLDTGQIKECLTLLNDQWNISDDHRKLVRRYTFKGFAQAVYLSNLCVWLADREGHHPDIAFGWGYCQVSLTTHDIGGLSENDFIWAAHLDNLTDTPHEI